jgi:hypothetical protein
MLTTRSKRSAGDSERNVTREWSMAKAQFAVIFGERFIKAMAA